MENTIVIKPKQKVFNLEEIREAFRFKDLFYILAERDVKIKYKQTLFGFAWVLFQPLISTLIFTLLFSRLPSFPTRGLPYPVFVFLGLTYWTYFSNALTTISGSLHGSEGIIKKVYFPRIIVPTSSIVAHAVDFSVSSVVFFIVALLFKVIPTPLFILTYFLGFLAVTTTALGGGLFLSALNIKYRDVRFIVPFFIQILIFLTPVFYPISIVNSLNTLILSLNPLTMVIEANRAILSGHADINYLAILVSLTSMTTLLLTGYSYFKKTERFISDIL